MWIICSGMIRSGSTWQYMVASHLAEQYMGGLRFGFFDAHVIKQANREAIQNGPRVFKIHSMDRRLGCLLDRGEAIGIYSYRDIRDVAVSSMKKWSLSLTNLLEDGRLQYAIDADRFWKAQKRTLVQRYDLIINDPIRAVEQIAQHLGIMVPETACNELSTRYSLKRSRERCRSLETSLIARGIDIQRENPVDIRDKFSELHWDHIQSGKNDRWRYELSLEQQQIISETFKDWLVDNRYPLI